MLYFHALLRKGSHERADRIEEINLGTADTEKGFQSMKRTVKSLRKV